jgi:hypothetical protein
VSNDLFGIFSSEKHKLVPQKTSEAIVEISSFDGEPPWALSPAGNQTFLRLFSGITDEEIGTVILTACLYNQIDVRPSASETIKAFLEEEQFVLPGGLQFSLGGQVKVVPGCCCGLEDWRGWLDVPNGANSVWAGHNPSPEVEFVNGGIRIWQDKKADGVVFIDFGVDEMHGLLRKVESDLKGFVVRLGKWTDSIALELHPKIVTHFANNMDI